MKCGHVGPPRCGSPSVTSTASPSSSSCDSRPQLAEALDAPARPRSRRVGVDEVLEAVHRHLAEHRRDRALDALGQQRQARLRRRRLLEQPAEDDRLAEHGRGLGHASAAWPCGRRPGGRASAACTPWPSSWASVSTSRRLRRVVEHHVRVRRTGPCRRRTRRRACRAAPARRSSARRRSARTSSPSSARERRVGVEHEVARLGPGTVSSVVGDRGHAVVVGEPVEAEQPRLEAVPAARQLVARCARRRPAPRPTRRTPRWRGCGSASQCG